MHIEATKRPRNLRKTGSRQREPAGRSEVRHQEQEHLKKSSPCGRRSRSSASSRNGVQMLEKVQGLTRKRGISKLWKIAWAPRPPRDRIKQAKIDCRTVHGQRQTENPSEHSAIIFQLEFRTSTAKSPLHWGRKVQRMITAKTATKA